VGNSDNGLTKAQVDDVHSLSLIHWVGHLVIEGDQVGQAGPAFHEPMLAGHDPLVVFPMRDEHTQDESLLKKNQLTMHSLSWCSFVTL